MTKQDLFNRMRDYPFKPFRLRLTTNSTIDILEPGLISIGESSAILPMEMVIDTEGYPTVKRWQTISLGHIVQMHDLDTRDDGQKKRRR